MFPVASRESGAISVSDSLKYIQDIVGQKSSSRSKYYYGDKGSAGRWVCVII